MSSSQIGFCLLRVLEILLLLLLIFVFRRFACGYHLTPQERPVFDAGKDRVNQTFLRNRDVQDDQPIAIRGRGQVTVEIGIDLVMEEPPFGRIIGIAAIGG